MKTKRHKHVRKVLTFYRNNFGLQPPYHVLVDGTFCKAALKFKVNIGEQLPKYLEAETKICTTKCVTAECEALGSLLYGPLKVLRQFDIVSCGHGANEAAGTCVKKLARKQKKQKYIVATQDPELSEGVRELVGVPLLYISHNAINLEAPSETCRQTASGVLQNKLTPSAHQQKTLDTIKRSVFGEPEVLPRRKKKKGPKGPNPLSCKKKTTKNPSEGVVVGKVDKTKRRRNRKKKKLNSNIVTGSVKAIGTDS